MEQSNRFRTAWTYVLLAVVLFIAGCGVKRPPKPLGMPDPPAVADLKHAIEGDTVHLKWSIPKTGSRLMDLAKGFIVYRSQTQAGAGQCEGCPILFKRIADVPLSTKAEDGALSYIDTLEPGSRYVYKVALSLDGGRLGPDSNYVEFAH